MSSTNRRQSVTGRWSGQYCYDPTEKMAVPGAVGFTLILKQGWFGRFSGTVTDGAGGMPGVGTIRGRLKSPRIEFVKQMPVSYVGTPEGVAITLRESVAKLGIESKADVPHAPIYYSGEFVDTSHAQGQWIIRAARVPLGDGRVLNMPEGRGTWRLEAMASANVREN